MESKDIEQNFLGKHNSNFDKNILDDKKLISKFGQIKHFIYKKKIYFIVLLVIFLTVTIVIISNLISSENNEETSKNEPIDYKKEEKTDKPEIEPIYNYYSERTKSYLNYLSSLEKENYIAYQYTFQNNSEGSFENKYQYLYDNDTSLIPNSSKIGNLLLYPESYLTVETEEIKYYKEVLKKEPPKHYVYGPSYTQDEYVKGQFLYNPNMKLNDTKDWKGLTISVNFRQLPFQGYNNGGTIFGWGSPEVGKPGFKISISYGIIVYKQGGAKLKYDYDDAKKVGYNDSIPEKRYLTPRLFNDDRWHQIIISYRKVTKDDERYLTELNLKEGSYKCELFIDGESRKNTSASPVNDYGEFSAFEFGNSQHNNNFFLDNAIVLKKGITLKEAKILFESIDQEAIIITPDIPNTRCRIPGKQNPNNPGEYYPDSEFKLKPETRFFQFTNKWTCLGFTYEDFLKERLIEFCGEHLKACDINFFYNKIKAYQYEGAYRADILDVLDYYIPQINEKFKNLETFRKYVKITSTNEKGGDLKNHAISNFGYWISSDGLLKVNKPHEEVNGIKLLPVANIRYFAYFELEGGYTNNRIYTISIENGDDITFVYNEEKIISYAIKVNQVGYSPLVKHHYGYIGRWMGTLGKLNLTEYVGKQFKLIQNDKEVFTGIIQWRTEDDPKYYTNGIETDLNGEQTLLLDISDYSGRGENYHFYIEGIGISFNFSISYKGVFTAFYTHMKGLYNQRTGIVHEKPYSYWETLAHHKGIYVAHHIPNDYHYSSNYITDDDTGEGFGDISQFEMIKETRTDEYWEDVFGGHADAGDYDNRPYHLQMIDILACLFLLKKNYLMDNQLNIPESNDNIPDILNEMEWGLQVHYLVQQKLNNGSVSTWIESTSHPGGLYENGTDPSRYYIGLSTREDTLRYAEAAGMLAICFKECSNCPEEKYKKWLKSAQWAFDWGINEENRCVYSFQFKGRNLTYREPDVEKVMISRAALVLYRLTKDEIYKKYIFNDMTGKNWFTKYYEGIHKLTDLTGSNPVNAMAVAIFKDDPDFDMILDAINTKAKKIINNLIYLQNNSTHYTYRNAYYYEKDHPYYPNVGWGGFIGSTQLALMSIYLYLNDGTEEGNKLLQTISYFYDFTLGCNHSGRTFTTNLGHHFPMYFVSHNNWWFNNKNIYDPIPGITLYTFYGGIEYDAFSKFYRIQLDGDKKTFNGVDLFLIPSFANLTNIPKEYAQIRDHLFGVIPFWRRMVNLELYSIRSSEYTVHETIVRMALASGLLLGSDEKINSCHDINECPSLFPSEELKNKSPKENVKDFLGRWSIP